jgi:hypothetical protein
MVRHPAFAAAALFACLAFAPATAPAAADNPHVSMDACPACHVVVPTPEEALAGDYGLTRPSIDETCRSCHAATACALGLGLVVHPSGIDTWDRRVCDGPKTLPLFNGTIACATCHYHLKPVGADFRMVRKAQFFGREVDLSAFCADCHEEYY